MRSASLWEQGLRQIMCAAARMAEWRSSQEITGLSLFAHIITHCNTNRASPVLAVKSEEARLAAYYNEIDPFAAQWPRNLIAAGHIAAGDVDERSIVDVRPADLIGYKLFAFIDIFTNGDYSLRYAIVKADLLPNNIIIFYFYIPDHTLGVRFLHSNSSRLGYKTGFTLDQHGYHCQKYDCRNNCYYFSVHFSTAFRHNFR